MFANTICFSTVCLQLCVTQLQGVSEHYNLLYIGTGHIVIIQVMSTLNLHLLVGKLDQVSWQ